MRRAVLSIVVLCLAVALLAQVQYAEETEKSPDAAGEKAVAGEMSPEVTKIVRGLADYLVGLDAFSCRMTSDVHIQANSRDNQMTTKTSVRIARPNRYALVVEEGMLGMTVVSDGKQVVNFYPTFNRYTVKSIEPAANEEADAGEAMMFGSFGNMAQFLKAKTGQELYDTLMDGVTEAKDLGSDEIDGVPCHHLQFVQKEFTWDLWVEKGDKPLPRKFVPDMSKQFASMGDRMKDTKIEFTISFSDWDTAPKFTDADFTFIPPDGAEKVESIFEGMGGRDEEAPHPVLGKSAPAIKTVDANGEPVDLSTRFGKDVVMLDFWATWCGPCVQALPQVNEVAKKFADRGVVFYAVNLGEDADTVKQFLADKQLDVPVAMDPEGKLGQTYHAEAIPQTVIVGKDGKVQVVHVGASENLAEELTKNLEDVLAGKDLAGEALKAAEERSKKQTGEAAGGQESPSAEDSSMTTPFGASPAWTVAGNWSGTAGDASTNIVFAAGRGKDVICVDATGSKVREFSIDQGGALRLANLVDDAEPEVVAFQAWTSGVRAHGGNGETLWEYPPGNGVDDVCVFDLNKDGVDEVIVGHNGGTGLHVLDSHGGQLWEVTDIGNVWHVTAGDFNGDGSAEVVTTSAAGQVHVFAADGSKLKDISVPLYANMVRMAKLDSGSTLAIVGGSSAQGESLVAVNFAGEKQWKLDLPRQKVAHIDDMTVASDKPWAAVAMRGGFVTVVDLDRGEIIALVADQGTAPNVAWLARPEKAPLLVVATGQALNAFEVTTESATVLR